MEVLTPSLDERRRRKDELVTNQTATVSECLRVHGSMTSKEIEELWGHWHPLDTRLRSFEPTHVEMDLYVKDRDTAGQHLTLEAKIAGWAPLVATTSEADFGHALNVVRDEMIRLIGDAKDIHRGHRKGGA